ncbi:MAG: hypothetical protein HYY01_00115 [Chloroflexi bacterium]|nr:hypothetical protein [Chloroflexota bacterium]
MSYGWRGIIGMISPTYRVGGLEEFVRLLPEGIGVIPLYGGAVRSGTEAELRRALEVAEEKVALLADLGADLITVDGAPPLLLQGYQAATQVVERLEAKYGKPVLATHQGQIEAFQELGIRRFAGITYFPTDLNRKFAQFFEEAGYQVAAMEGYPTAFTDAGKIPAEEIYAFAKRVFRQVGGADGIYMMGGAWHPLPIIAMLERDLGVPVVASPPAKLRAVLKRLKVKHTYHGCGRLLEMP